MFMWESCWWGLKRKHFCEHTFEKLYFRSQKSLAKTNGITDLKILNIYFFKRNFLIFSELLRYFCEGMLTISAQPEDSCFRKSGIRHCLFNLKLVFNFSLAQSVFPKRIFVLLSLKMLCLGQRILSELPLSRRDVDEVRIFRKNGIRHFLHP